MTLKSSFITLIPIVFSLVVISLPNLLIVSIQEFFQSLILILLGSPNVSFKSGYLSFLENVRNLW